MPGLTDEEEERETPQPHVAPKIDKIAPLIAKDGKIDKEEEKLQKSRSALGNVYKQIEADFHGNRAAVKQVRKLLTGTTDAAYDFMRTFMRLADHFGLIPEDDLVDMMENRPKEEPDEDPGVRVSDQAPKKKNEPVQASDDNPIDRHKERLKNGGKPPAPTGPKDNADLADAGTAVAAEIEAQRSRDAAAFEGQTAH